MKKMWVFVLAVASCPLWGSDFREDIYKCPSGEYTNIRPNEDISRQMAELTAMGCKRVRRLTDPVSVNGREQITIPVSKDGHFRLNGEINGRPILFMVDTGATSTSITKEFAKDANLVGGEPATFNTANGKMSGRIHKNIRVMAGGFTISKVDVAVALVGGDPNTALLGQNFLSQFEMTLDDRQMILRNKK